MGNLVLRLLAWVGNALLAAGRACLQLLWELVAEALRGLARGVADALRQAAPWALGIGALLGVLAFVPELLNMLLVLGIMVWGIRTMFRGLNPFGGNRRR